MGAKLPLLFLSFALGLGFIYLKLTHVPPLPQVENTWWGPGSSRKDDVAVRPFKIDIPEEVIGDLQKRLNNTLPFQTPLEDAKQHYGMNANLLNTIVDYWKNKYNWKKRQEFLNQFPQFKTEIQGLNIHFLHVKPTNVPKGVDVLPLLLLHGWPGSTREFYEILPILTTPQKGRNFVFEVVAPSLPGYGFSDGASKQGLGPFGIAKIFDNLMQKLKYKKYYIQGGDWGSIISTDIAILFADHVIAIHKNLCFVNSPISNLKLFIGSFFPSLIAEGYEIEANYPLSKTFSFILLETGYMHLQSTKPDTVGVALRDSPAGLAAYIIEKFTTWTNPEWKDLDDGGLTRKFTLDKLLDNVMIYWVTRSITTSMRLYSENFNKARHALGIDRIPITIPSGCSRFKNEIAYLPKSILKERYKNLVHVSDHEDGGHFAAFELPDVLAKDVYDFVEIVRKSAKKNPEL
ncbi:juvenile hormone epoxide hydrolase 1-like [Sitophilus oryzae]|uniref:Epoxide hydrolase n=1 Tax=Sitophilus oryzae TaxID=7048 RepID=A0A6J2YAK7_SITOR|nr:juvenile hormone epoxide hydrolase 1-like [Sitophilus oryzae]